MNECDHIIGYDCDGESVHLNCSDYIKDMIMSKCKYCPNCGEELKDG